jgi:hypothetical protein
VKIERLRLQVNEADATALVKRLLSASQTRVDTLSIRFEEGVIRTEAMVTIPLGGPLSVSALWQLSVTPEGGIRLEMVTVRAVGLSGGWLKSVLMDRLTTAAGVHEIRADGDALVVDPALWEKRFSPPIEMRIRTLTIQPGLLIVEA